MGFSLLRFSSIMSTAVTMSAAFAHFMELPAKMNYDGPLYAKLHRTLYPNFGRVAGIAEIIAVITTAAFAWKVRQKQPGSFPAVTAAATGLAIAHGAFWICVEPANKNIASWDLDAIPPDWKHWRDQWEYTHAARAALVTGALAALVTSPTEEVARTAR